MKITTTSSSRVPLLHGLVAFGLLGCNDASTKDPDPPCVPVAGEVCPDEDSGGGTGDETGDETGGETGDPDEPRELEPGECRFNEPEPDDPLTGWRYECEGELRTRMSFDVLGEDCVDVLGEDWCVQDFPFSYAPYANAEVIACCGEYDPDLVENYKLACTYDVYQQLCITLGEKLEASINAGDFGIYKSQAIDLQNWVVDNYTDCFNAFNLDNAATPPQMQATWTLGDFGQLKNVAVHIDAPSEVLGVNIPTEPDEWIACSDASGNDDEVFEDEPSPGPTTILALADSIDAGLVGPALFGSKPTAYARFEARCSPRGCPEAALSIDPDAGTLTLTNLELYEDDPVQIGEGSLSLVADRVRIDLWGAAQGHRVLDSASSAHVSWTIPAGAAQFMIAGLSHELGANRLMAQNTQPIELRELDGLWSIAALELTFVDGAGRAWIVDVDPSSWRG